MEYNIWVNEIQSIRKDLRLWLDQRRHWHVGKCYVEYSLHMVWNTATYPLELQRSDYVLVLNQNTQTKAQKYYF